MYRKYTFTWAIALIIILVVALAGCSTNPTQTAASSDTANTAQIPSDTTTNTQETDAQPEVSASIVKLNLNTATGDDYQALIPNFSDRMVREFLEYRPYISIQQFRKEIGKYVDDTQVAEWEKYVYVPVDVDNSDAETLKQLPGVDDTIAANLIAARPFGSNDAFLSKLAEYVSPEDAAAAAAYLAQ